MIFGKHLKRDKWTKGARLPMSCRWSFYICEVYWDSKYCHIKFCSALSLTSASISGQALGVMVWTKQGQCSTKKNRMPLCHVFFLLQYEQFIYIYIEFLRFFWQLRNMMKHDRMSLYSFDFESYTHVRGWRRNSLLLEPNSGLVTGKSISCSSCYTIMFSSQFTVI